VTDLSAVATPALVIDVARADRNCARVAAYAAEHGLSWRPHVKTHKSVWAATRQLAHGAGGLSCATPREAEVMRGVTDDLLLAYPPIGAERLTRTVALAERSRLGVMLDSRDAAAALSQALSPRGATARVVVEVDAGMRRLGVRTVAEAVALAEEIARLPGLAFDGFGFYPGHLRSAGPEVGASLMEMSSLIAALRAASAAVGLDVRTISCGSTPLLWRSHEIAGMTELRAGTAVYFDRTSVIGGVCSYDDCAASILATVVSTAVPGQAVVDAGVKALGREPMRGGTAEGFACVLDRPDVPVVRLSEEHGILDLTHTDWRPRTGDQVRLLPNHVCVAVHNFDAMTLVHPDGRMETVPVEARGR
jgi:D-serine deaminase-like pyridoxal phosphate-dependent protein